MDIEEIREDFPILSTKMRGKPLVYFDTAATAQKPRQVIDALTRFYLYEYATIHRAIYEISLLATERYDETRTKAAKFIKAQEEEIVFVKNTTEGINLIAYSYGGSHIKEGDEIIITQMEHHSNIVPWQLLCERKKARLKIVPINERAEIDLNVFETLLTEKTKIVAIAHVANATGTINPIKQVIDLAHKKNAVVVIDGAQSAAHMVVDVKNLDADFYVFSSHKIYGPNGVGILYGKKELLEAMPPFQGGGDMIEKVTFQKTIYQEPPLRFEAGTPAFSEVIALAAAFDYIENIGRENIFTYEKTLLDYATEKLSEFPEVRIIGTAKEKGPIISFVVDKIHAFDLGTMLDLEGIAFRTGHHCAQPTLDYFKVSSTARISFGLYNTKEEIDYFLSALKKIILDLK